MKLGWRINPYVQISLKKENLVVLEEIKDFLFQNYGVTSKVKNKATASSPVLKNPQYYSLEMEGLKNVEIFMKKRESSIPNPLIGLKYYDFCLMEEIYKLIALNTILNKVESKL